MKLFDDQIAVIRKIRELLVARQAETLGLVRSLVEAESPTGDESGNGEVVALLLDAAQRFDLSPVIERTRSENYGEHLRLTFFPQQTATSSRTLILGHTDTVHPRGTIIERPYRIDGERIYGPGIFDMKANCALALQVVRACADLTAVASDHEIVMLLTCDEEEGSATGRALVEGESRRAAQVLVLEPAASGGRVKTGRKGTGGWTLRAEGRAAHAGLEPEKGASAILEIARQIERLHALNDYARGTTLNVGVVRGGTTSNVVAAEAMAEIDVRYTSASEAERITVAIEQAAPFDERVRLYFDGGINRPPLERTAEVIELFERARAIAAALDFELGEAQVGGASDGNFAAAFCPAVLDGLGVAGDGAHAAHEHIIGDSLPTRGALLAGLLISSNGDLR